MKAVNHLGLWWEEFEGEIIAMFGHRSNFVRDLLHLTFEPSRLKAEWVVVENVPIMLDAMDDEDGKQQKL